MPVSLQRAAGRGEIAEFQGLYGAFHVSELLLQKLWLRGDFDSRRAVTLDGAPLRILSPGKWNRLGGPDFVRARLEIGGREISGDVEVHFRADAWRQHGHHADPAYDKVILHVVLFPPAADRPPMKTSRGRPIPILVLVDLLWHDLEEYAADDAVAALNGVDPLPVVQRLLALDLPHRTRELQSAAAHRWRQKVHFARLRIDRLGWAEACHQTALEVLGYRNNRPAMLRVAAAFPHADWQERAPAVEALWKAGLPAWRSQGVRPANHPRTRLSQYCAWMKENADWPQELRRLELPRWPGDVNRDHIARLRRAVGLVGLRKRLAAVLSGGAVTGSRWDTLVANMVFPFLAAERGQGSKPGRVEALWNAWYPGDVPDSLRKAIRQLDPSATRTPIHNGLVQGLLGLQLAHSTSG